MLRLTAVLLFLATATASGQRSPSRGISTDAARLLLALDRLQASRWYPSTPQLRDAALSDQALLSQALSSSSTELRRIAVRGIGRFERPADIPTLSVFLADNDPGVRREAVHAIAQTVIHRKDDEVVPAYEALTAAQPPLMTRAGGALTGPDVDAVEQTRLEAIARLHYSPAMAQQVIRTFAAPRHLWPMLLMLRQNPSLEVRDGQLRPLLDQIRILNPQNLPDATGFEILKLTGRLTTPLIVAASAYRCPRDVLPFPCSALRQLGVQNLIADAPEMTSALRRALDDPWPEVRVHALRRVGEAVKRTGDCGPLIDSLMDAGELAMVRIEALGQLDPRCDQIKDAIRLAREYTVIADAPASPTQGWAMRARAIEVLAKLDAAATLDALEHASRDLWQVRAARARAAMSLRSLEWLRKYADDDDPNVRAEVLRDLTNLRDPSRIDMAIRSLDSTDYELVATAAEILEREGQPIDLAVPSLWSAFKRLTLETRETARFARLAILTCLEAWAPPRDNITPVRPYVEDLRLLLRDADPFVAEAASRVIFRVTGVKLAATPTWRPPLQPDVTDLLALPASAIISLDSGETIGIEFLRNEAPIAIARFVKLIKSGYFRDQPLFYRLTPMIAVNGGSPDGNDLSGDARFWRDEIGLERHRAGAIGLLSHGRDTADGRFFIDFSDQSGFDDEYTLFARIGAMRLNEPWSYATPPPVSALVRGGNILIVRLP